MSKSDDSTDMNIIDAYIAFTGQFIVALTGLSDCGRDDISKLLSKDTKLQIINQKQYYVPIEKLNPQYQKFKLSDGSVVSIWETNDNFVEWDKFNKVVNDNKKNGIIINAFSLPVDKIDFMPDIHVHFNINRGKCIARIIEKNKDLDPGILNEKLTPVYEYYKELLPIPKITKFFTIKSIEDQSLSDLYDLVWDYVIETKLKQLIEQLPPEQKVIHGGNPYENLQFDNIYDHDNYKPPASTMAKDPRYQYLLQQQQQQKLINTDPQNNPRVMAAINNNQFDFYNQNTVPLPSTYQNNLDYGFQPLNFPHQQYAAQQPYIANQQSFIQQIEQLKKQVDQLQLLQRQQLVPNIVAPVQHYNDDDNNDDNDDDNNDDYNGDNNDDDYNNDNNDNNNDDDNNIQLTGGGYDNPLYDLDDELELIRTNTLSLPKLPLLHNLSNVCDSFSRNKSKYHISKTNVKKKLTDSEKIDELYDFIIT